MPLWSRRLKQLRHELLALGEEAMLVEELDGFFAGLLVCPDLIKPGEWLPIVWDGDNADLEPAFEDLDHANRVLGLIMEHYNAVARALMEHGEGYKPLLPVDKRNGDVIWEVWIEGFERAIKLRPKAWKKLLEADAETAAAMAGMLTLVDMANRPELFTREDRDALIAAAPYDIERWIPVLNEWRLENYNPLQAETSTWSPSSAPAKKVGRNDPCPCGSSKKYKKCCGLH
jgi:uncharacterized protein